MASLVQWLVGALFFIGGGIYMFANARSMSDRAARVIGLKPGEHWRTYTYSLRVGGLVGVMVGLGMLIGLATGFWRLG